MGPKLSCGQKDPDGKEKKSKGKGLSFRRNIQMNIDIDNSTNPLDNSNTSEVTQNNLCVFVCLPAHACVCVCVCVFACD